MKNHKSLKKFLDDKVEQYNTRDFISSDPIQIPHRFKKKEDIEIAGFLTATIAWGNRTSIINNAIKMIDLLDGVPYDFIINHRESDLKPLEKFVHRTFNGTDFITFVLGLKNVYLKHGGMETVFSKYSTTTSTQLAIAAFKEQFFSIPHLPRTEKHISNPNKGSSAKRINMMLRWFCRSDSNGVDFGIWKKIPQSALSCPLDVHTGNVARKLGLLSRKQNDAKAVNELDTNLRALDCNDPVKYDYALFGLGVFEGFC